MRKRLPIGSRTSPPASCAQRPVGVPSPLPTSARDARWLCDALEAHEWFPVRRALAIGLDVAHGLLALERQRAVHLAVHPGAVALLPSGAARLCAQPAVSLPAAGQRDAWRGFDPYAARYLAPEQIAGSARLDARTDVYAFGSVLFHMLSGVLPFHADSASELLRMRTSGVPPRVGLWREEAPRRLERLVGRCLAFAPDDRPASATQLMDELLAVAGSVRREG